MISYSSYHLMLLGAHNLPPVCTKTYVSLSIVEGVKIGTTVFDFKTICSDPEKGPLTFTLNNNANSQFVVPASTTLLQTNKAADAEAVLSYATKYFASPWTVRVIVKDNAEGTCVLTVVIKINSTNDNPATIEKLMVPHLPEDTLKGTIIGGCTLVDGDYPGSGHDIPYVEITAGNEDNKFAIDYKNCDIFLVGDLDYETKMSYTLTLRAYNFANDPNATTKTVTIQVTDVNDNRPICGSSNILKNVPEDKVANDILLKLNCSDADSGDNGKLQFFIDPKGNSTKLKVNETSGEISLTSDLDFDGDPAGRHLEIIMNVADHGKPELITKLFIHFRVTDVDDQPPVFTQSVYYANVSENADIGQLILSVKATDNDSPFTALSKITFGFETPCTQDWLRIDNYTGTIVVSNFLHWEITPVITCRVYACSSDKYVNRSFADVHISVIDVNDNTPIFSQISYEGTVIENAPAFTSVLTLSATDPDEGDNGQFTFSFLPSNDSPFAVDPYTGLVYVSATGIVDYETKTSYIFLVVARDNGIHSMASQAYISISVFPVNEYSPYISKQNDIYISELAKPGSQITKIISSDNDAGDDGKIIHYFQDSDVPFILEMETGALYINFGLDYESYQTYGIVVIVEDCSKTIVKSSTTTFNIHIINENEYEPVCDNVEPVKVLHNDTRDPLCQLNCVDFDSDTVLQFDILKGDNNNVFKVNPNTGAINFATSPKEGSYLIVIRIRDQCKPEKISETSVQIDVETDLMFTNLPANLIVSENTNVTSLLYTVSAKGALGHTTYTIISGNVDGKFSLHQMTGTLMLFSRLDREMAEKYELTIRAITIFEQYVERILTITVEDYNDNAPKYCCSLDYIRIPETQSVPYQIASYIVTDDDIKQNAENEYIVLSGDPDSMFRYEKSGELILMNKLDYEKQPFHTLVLCARNRGNPLLNTTIIVNIEVTDVIDNSLAIVPSGGKINLTLPENTAIGSVVTKIVLQNNYNNCELTFIITSGNDGNNFTIGQKTGIVHLTYPLDRESAGLMKIGVQVKNINGEKDDTILEINIIDSNDNDPVLDPSNRLFFVPHGTKAGSRIATLNVIDPDIGRNSDVNLSIISGDPNGDFEINGKTLLAAAFLDANLKNMYELLVLICDYGTPSRNSTNSIIILINQELEIPVFVPKVSSISVEETCIPGSLLFDANAISNGTREKISGDLLYSLKGKDSSIFYIEQHSGQLQLIGALNYSANSSYALTIIASNKYNPSLNDSLTMTVTVTQVNRYDPVCTSDIFVWYVDEIIGLGTIVGRVTAIDLDPGEFGVLRYEVESNIYFAINSSTGALSLIHTLDYSTAKSHNLLVTVTDNAGIDSRNAFCLVVIYVVDWNNHVPSFTNVPYEVTVPETLSVGTTILVVHTEDADSKANGTVLYKIISGNSKGMFNLDPSSGALSLSSSLDFESVRQHVFIIEGKDCGTIPLSNSTIVTVKVRDENDNTPYFETERKHISIRRDTPPMTSIGQILASDSDSGLNGAVWYTIHSGDTDHLFNIETYKGVVRTTRSLATANSYQTLIVYGIDQGQSQLTGTMTVSILIIPIVNPVACDYEFAVLENERADTLVGTIPEDSTLNGIKGSTITGGNYENAFSISIDKNEGVLRTNKILDREACEYYQLTVSVVHLSGVKDICVTIKVLDVNDNFPVFDKWILELQVVENLPKGNVVGALHVKDADQEGVNSEIHLSISPPGSIGSVYFTVEPSGIIKVAEPVSYEKYSFLKLYVIARDSGVPEQFSTATVMVTIADIVETHEYKQTDTAIYKSFEFPDDAVEGEEVCQLTAADYEMSLGPDDTLKFITVGAESVFHVHASTGILKINRPAFIFKRTRYFQWSLGTLMSAGVKTSRLLMVRLDTFNKVQHLITVKVDTDLDTLRLQIEILRLRLQSFYQPSQAVRIWRTQSISQSSQRRLLDSAKSEALFVVIADDAANTMSNVLMTKTFLPSAEAVKPLQASPDGTPVQSLASSSPSVISILPYPSPDTSTDVLDPAFISLIVMGCITGLALIIGAVAAKVYCILHRRSEKEDDVNVLVNQDNNKIRKASFEIIGNSDTENKRTSIDSSMSNRSSLTNAEGASLIVTDGNSVSLSQSLIGRDSSSSKRNITPVNEPNVDQFESLEKLSDQHINSSSRIGLNVDDVRSERTCRATSIVVSMLDPSQRPPESLTSMNSSTMLSNLEDDTFADSGDTSTA